MKILVIHDDHGKIRSIGVPARKFSGQVRLHAREGYLVTEFDAPDLKDELDHKQLEHIKANFRVEVSSTGPRLVRK